MKIASEIKLPVKIVNGKFSSNLNTIRDILIGYEGMTIDVIFKKRQNKRSNKQNSYYWGCIEPITRNCIKEEWGEIWSIDRTHDFLLTNCNYQEIVNEETGEILRRTRRTTENSTVQQEDFHEKCRRLVREFFNVEIPLPNNDLKLKF